MKVKYASQVMSYTVSAVIHFMVTLGALPENALATVEVLKTMNGLFDSVNGFGLKPEGYQGLRMAITRNNVQSRMEFWDDCKRKLKLWQFMKEPHKTGTARPFRPPSLTGWIRTLNGFQVLWTTMTQVCPDLQFLEARRVNQDPLENMFGLVWSMCGSCQNPFVVMFISAFRTSIINGLAYRDQKDTNCEPEITPSPTLHSLRSLLNTPGDQKEVPYASMADENVKFCLNKLLLNDQLFEGAVVEYVSGYVARKVLTGSACNACNGALLAEENRCPEFGLISAKEYYENQRLLNYPSTNLINVVTSMCTSFEEIIPDKSHYCQLSKHITNISS